MWWTNLKILVNVAVPAISEHYDILVPNAIRIRNIVSLIASTVEDLSDQQYVASGSECLCSLEKNILLRHNATLDDYGIQNGDHLIMM